MGPLGCRGRVKQVGQLLLSLLPSGPDGASRQLAPMLPEVWAELRRVVCLQLDGAASSTYKRRSNVAGEAWVAAVVLLHCQLLVAAA